MKTILTDTQSTAPKLVACNQNPRKSGKAQRMRAYAFLVGVWAAIVFPDLGLGQSASPSAAPVRVNRTVPKVGPPKTGLEFSANPTTQEIFRARVFEEPLLPIGGEPSAEENAALAAALLGYAKRNGPDDFASLTGFLDKHPNSPWRAALLTSLGLEYYNTAHYSLALDAWEKAWPLAKDAADFTRQHLSPRFRLLL